MRTPSISVKGVMRGVMPESGRDENYVETFCI